MFSIERESAGNPMFPTGSIPKVAGVTVTLHMDVGEAMYSQVADKIVIIQSRRGSELARLLENIYRSVIPRGSTNRNYSWENGYQLSGKRLQRPGSSHSGLNHEEIAQGTL